MNPLTLVVVLGFLGGLILAAVVILLQRRQQFTPSVIVSTRLPVTTDVINMASIKVTGIGGLGLVAMAAAVAVDVPLIGQSIAVGLALGMSGALVAILWRRRTGPLPSSSRYMGANSVLSIDVPTNRQI
ncbi:hypothetical protein BH18ACI5_BH18ACI5_24170 [soil metagenome]